jgi:hypothetical protein
VESELFNNSRLSTSYNTTNYQCPKEESNREKTLPEEVFSSQKCLGTHRPHVDPVSQAFSVVDEGTTYRNSEDRTIF